eukprot:126277_1
MSNKENQRPLKNISNQCIDTNVQFPTKFDEIANRIKTYNTFKSLLSHKKRSAPIVPMINSKNDKITPKSSTSSLSDTKHFAPKSEVVQNIQQISKCIKTSCPILFERQMKDVYRVYLNTQYIKQKQYELNQSISNILGPLQMNVDIIDDFASPTKYIGDLEVLFSEDSFVTFDKMLGNIL